MPIIYRILPSIVHKTFVLNNAPTMPSITPRSTPLATYENRPNDHKFSIIFAPVLYSLMCETPVAVADFATCFSNPTPLEWKPRHAHRTTQVTTAIVTARNGRIVNLHRPTTIDASDDTRGGTIDRCIDISRYFSRNTYRDIIFYNRNFLFNLVIFFFFFFFHNDFHLGRKET